MKVNIFFFHKVYLWVTFTQIKEWRQIWKTFFDSFPLEAAGCHINAHMKLTQLARWQTGKCLHGKSFYVTLNLELKKSRSASLKSLIWQDDENMRGWRLSWRLSTAWLKLRLWEKNDILLIPLTSALESPSSPTRSPAVCWTSLQLVFYFLRNLWKYVKYLSSTFNQVCHSVTKQRHWLQDSTWTPA